MARYEVGERRQLTVMFCDLVDATALSSSLDPEDYGDLVRAFRSSCEEVVGKLGGFVAQFMGDGVLVYFGYPAAQEDAALRAVTAGLRITAESEALAAGRTFPSGWQPRVRVGIHAGIVVTTADDAARRGAELALGSAPNIASRLQSIAAPGSVVVSEHIHRLTTGFFEVELLGERNLKGVSEPIQVIRVLRHRSANGRFLGSEPSPLLERDHLRSELTQAWAGAAAGRGSTVCLRGEPGVGKSRIVHELQAWLHPAPRWVHGACSAQEKARSFACIAGALASWAGIEDGDPPSARLEKLERALEASGLISQDYLAVGAWLLEAPLPPDRTVPLQLSSQELRKSTIAVLVRWLLALGEREPVVLCFEDLHWVDPSSEEVIVEVLQKASAASLFCVCTYRPSFVWSASVPVVTVDVPPLSAEGLHALVQWLAGGDLAPGAVERIAEQSDGIPLFAEELTRATLETSTGSSLGSAHVPPTLHDSLMARLDRLGEGRRVAQLAAICGRQFSEELLGLISPMDEGTIARGLSRLLDAGILQRSGGSQLSFKHALVRDAAYDSMLKATRRRYHLTMAEALRRSAETSRPELLAHHFFEGGRPAPAAELWLIAAQRAAERAASKEAESYLEHVTSAITELTSEDERNELELKAQLVRGQLAIADQGYAAPAVELVFSRALELCKRLGHVPSTSDVTKLLASRVLCSEDLNKLRPASNPLFWVLWGFGAFYQARAEHRRALEVAQQMLRMAAGNPELLVEGHFGAGSSLYYLGQFREAADHLLRGFELSRQVDHRAATPTGHRADFLCLGYASLALWHLGETERAAQLNEQAFTLAQSLEQPYLAASGHAMRASLTHLMRDNRACLDASDAALELADKHGFGFVKIWVKPLLGWSMVQTTGNALGLQHIEETLDAYSRSGTSVFRTHVLGVAADCHLALGDVTNAGLRLDEALRLADATGERFCEPELFTLRARACLQAPVPEPAVALAALRRAVRQAREQEAWGVEPRIVRLLTELGGSEEPSPRAPFGAAPRRAAAAPKLDPTNVSLT